jgi:HD-like signal output (HDOD) protein
LSPSFISGMQALLRSGTQLPTLPVIVFELHAVLDREDATSIDVARVIERDPALTARLLRAANSAAFSRGGDRISTVAAAVQRIGVGQVRTLCLVLAVVQAFGKGEGLSHDALWEHSAAVGAVARRLWTRAAGTGAGLEDLYVAGLLHDVGLLVIDQFFPADFAAVQTARREMDLPLWQQEEDSLGMDHGDVGGLLLGSWGLPPLIVDAVTYHHREDEAPPASARVCLTVAAAEAVCLELGFGHPAESHPAVVAGPILTKLGIRAEDQAGLLETLRPVADAARALLA